MGAFKNFQSLYLSQSFLPQSSVSSQTLRAPPTSRDVCTFFKMRCLSKTWSAFSIAIVLIFRLSFRIPKSENTWIFWFLEDESYKTDHMKSTGFEPPNSRESSRFGLTTQPQRDHVRLRDRHR